MIALPSGLRVNLIGDPHLGRRFETGVPLNRRGEREASQMAQFRAELDVDCDINIMVGDLFDHPQVGYGVVLDAAEAYIEAAKHFPDAMFVALAGNHDKSRNLSAIGAWEVFRELVAGQSNIIVVDEPCWVGTVALMPWEWGRSALDQIDDLRLENPDPVELCVGHWDFIDYGGDASHMAPAKALRDLFPDAKLVSGHYHLPGEYEIDGIEVTCTGSMQPYSHAEDPAGNLYVTLTLGELLERGDLRDKCVRVLLKEGEELPSDLDCLALTAKRVVEGEQESIADKVGAFDWQAILDECLKDVPDYVRTFIDERLAHV